MLPENGTVSQRGDSSILLDVVQITRSLYARHVGRTLLHQMIAWFYIDGYIQMSTFFVEESMVLYLNETHL